MGIIIRIKETKAPSPTCIVQGRPKNTTTLLGGMTHYLRRDESQVSEGDQLGIGSGKTIHNMIEHEVIGGDGNYTYFSKCERDLYI